MSTRTIVSKPGVLALAALGLLLLAAMPRDQDGPAQVTVTNFPEVQQVAGKLAIERPIPATRLVQTKLLVSPAQPTDLTSLTDGGILDATGFVAATLSLHVDVQGNLLAPGKVGAILIPDVPEVIDALRSASVVQFPITVEAGVVPSPSGLHYSQPVTFRLAFPRYKVYFYDTAAKSAEVVLYSYLSNS